MKNTYLFDLDGTLVDTSEGILNSIQKTITTLNLSPKSVDELRFFIGPPLKEAFEKLYGMAEDDAKNAVTTFREFYKAGDNLVCCPYEGMSDLLDKLKTSGHQLFVATSKPTVFAEAILDKFELSQYFDAIIGSNLDNTRSTKAEVINYILDNYDVLDNVYMIGDKAQDLIGALKCNLPGIGVTYGFGTREELESVQNLIIVDSVNELLDELLVIE